MTDEDMGRIGSLKQQGKSAAAIAEMLHLSANTVKSYLRRHPGTEDARNAGKRSRRTRAGKKRGSVRTDAGWGGGVRTSRK